MCATDDGHVCSEVPHLAPRLFDKGKRAVRTIRLLQFDRSSHDPWRLHPATGLDTWASCGTHCLNLICLKQFCSMQTRCAACRSSGDGAPSQRGFAVAAAGSRVYVQGGLTVQGAYSDKMHCFQMHVRSHDVRYRPQHVLELPHRCQGASDRSIVCNTAAP